MSDTATAHDLQIAVRHARWRWAGAPLLVSGVVLLLWALVELAGGGSGLTLMLGLFGTGMGLASFGANHDTAIAYAVRVRTGGGGASLPGELSDEVDEELDRDRAGTLGLRPAPRVAMVLPLVALGVQALVAFRLITG